MENVACHGMANNTTTNPRRNSRNAPGEVNQVAYAKDTFRGSQQVAARVSKPGFKIISEI